MAYVHSQQPPMHLDPSAPFYHSDDARAMAAMSGQPMPQPMHSGQPMHPPPSTSGQQQETKNVTAHHSAAGAHPQNVAVVVPKDSHRPIAIRGTSGSKPPGYTPWSWGSTIFASIAVVLCCSLCSFLGILCSVLSYVDHKSGDMKRAAKKRRWSWACTVLAFILALAAVIVMVVLVTVKRDELKEWLCDEGYKEACENM